VWEQLEAESEQHHVPNMAKKVREKKKKFCQDLLLCYDFFFLFLWCW
jgi:hypothetical protein